MPVTARVIGLKILSNYGDAYGAHIQELQFDTGSDLFEIVEITKSEDSVTIRFNSVPGRIYAVEASGDLTDWEEIDDSVVGELASQTTEFTESPLPEGTLRRYYRVRG